MVDWREEEKEEEEGEERMGGGWIGAGFWKGKVV
jgi:hypothetical protein